MNNDSNKYGPDESSPLTGIQLQTLTIGGGDTIDFRACFERAMKARHLPSHEFLLVINPREVVLNKIIGEGSFGRVWSGQWRNNAVAVKEFVFAQAAFAGGSLQRNSIIEEIVGEAGLMACLRHPKILQLYGCSLTMQAIWIVSELCVRGSLRMLLTDSRIDLPLIKQVSICLDIADGMLYLHSRNPPLIHRDLKSHNIFIAEPSPGQFVAKIGDWGSARAVVRPCHVMSYHLMSSYDYIT
jgi:serine/threonine protein kinase